MECRRDRMGRHLLCVNTRGTRSSRMITSLAPGRIPVVEPLTGTWRGLHTVLMASHLIPKRFTSANNGQANPFGTAMKTSTTTMNAFAVNKHTQSMASTLYAPVTLSSTARGHTRSSGEIHSVSAAA